MSETWQIVWITGIIIAVFGAAFMGVEALRSWAARGHALDVPNERSSHTRPTPRGGGLAIAVGTLVGLWVLASALRLPLDLRALIGYSLGSLLIAAVSWRDDLRPLSSRIRFSTHVVGALLVLLSVGWLSRFSLPLLPSFSLGLLGSILTLLWLVSIVNIYNFMDGIDGIAGVQAVSAGLAWGMLGWWFDLWLVAVLGLLVATTSGGFLLHNWPPARIFMGDVGSAFLGFTFATLSIMAGVVEPRLAFVGLVLLWPFVFDTTFTLLRRWRRGENIFIAHRSHLYQRLVIAGLSHRRVTLYYLALTLTSCALAILWLLLPAIGSWLLALWLITSAAGICIYVQKTEAMVAYHKKLVTASSQPELS